jgi:hypothetical protein
MRTEGYVTELAVHELNSYPKGPQNNIIYFFLPETGFKKAVKIPDEANLLNFHSINRLQKSLASSIVLTGLESNPQS